MSDISMPPTTPAPAQPQPQRKYLLDNIALKFFILLCGYISPLPVAIAISQLWLNKMGNGADNALQTASDALNGTGSAPQWIWPLALLPAVLMFVLAFKTVAGRLVAIISLLPVSFVIVWLAFQNLPAAIQ